MRDLKAPLRPWLLLTAVAALAGCYTWSRTGGDLPQTEYYADLGPDTIDVSSYPAAQRRAYETFARACSRCHTLARAVNSPTESRTYWRFHLARMNLHARFFTRAPLSKEELREVLDFLDYDARERKIRRRESFQKQEEELKKRFEPILQRQLDILSRGG